MSHRASLGLALIVASILGAAEIGFRGGILGALGLAEVTRAAEPEAWTCPMESHADVRSSTAGPCPKCGMDLVPISQTTHKGVLPGKAATPGADSPEKAATPGTDAPEKTAEPAPEGKTGEPTKAPSPEPPPPPRKGKITYYCPMHPKYISDRPGDCPICNMKLDRLEASGTTLSKISDHALVKLSPYRRQLIGVRTAVVSKEAVTRTIRAYARVDASERGLSAVNLKYGGWIEELHVDATGQRVRKGDPLFTIYSPEVLEAQKNYVAALAAARALSREAGAQARSFAEDSVRSARERLILWDFTPEQVAELEGETRPAARTRVLSRVDGVVTRKNVVQGSYAEPMKDLYEIADLSTVWIQAEVYEDEVDSIAEGAEASVHLAALPGKHLMAPIAFISPTLDEVTRTARIRLEVPNPDGRLRPGMYGTVALPVSLGEGIAIDDQAVLDSGTRKIVFVETAAGEFEPREVLLGPRSDARVIVRAGLESGERIVTSGNFLVDSESRLKAALLGRDTTVEGVGAGASGSGADATGASAKSDSENPVAGPAH